MVDHSTAVTKRKPGQLGPPETITPKEAATFIGLIKRGLSEDMAATYTGRSLTGLKEYCNRYRDLALRIGEAKAHKTLYHLRNLDRISRTRDVRGFNAAVKASENMLRAHDPRFRKDPDAMTPGVGGGVTIIVQSGSQEPSGLGFAGSGGVIDAEAVVVLESRADLGADAGPDPKPAPAELADLLPPEQPGGEAASGAEIESGERSDGANEAGGGETNETQTYF